MSRADVGRDCGGLARERFYRRALEVPIRPPRPHCDHGTAPWPSMRPPMSRWLCPPSRHSLMIRRHRSVVSTSEARPRHGDATFRRVHAEGPSAWAEGPSVDAVVGVTGFEPAASSSRTTRATKLRHTPLQLEKSTLPGAVLRTTGGSSAALTMSTGVGASPSREREGSSPRQITLGELRFGDAPHGGRRARGRSPEQMHRRLRAATPRRCR